MRFDPGHDFKETSCCFLTLRKRNKAIFLLLKVQGLTSAAELFPGWGHPALWSQSARPTPWSWCCPEARQRRMWGGGGGNKVRWSMLVRVRAELRRWGAEMTRVPMMGRAGLKWMQKKKKEGTRQKMLKEVKGKPVVRRGWEKLPAATS